jgi:hypothetical protein
MLFRPEMLAQIVALTRTTHENSARSIVRDEIVWSWFSTPKIPPNPQRSNGNCTTSIEHKLAMALRFESAGVFW